MVYQANMRAMSIADVLISQAMKIGQQRELAALLTGIESEAKLQAEAILRSMNEEASNLRPRFTEAERELLLRGLCRLMEDDYESVDRVLAKDLIEMLKDMHVTDQFIKRK